MIPIEYEDYELSEVGLVKAKRAYYNYAVMEYIKAHGEVDQPVEYFENIPADFLESFRQREYAEYYRRNYSEPIPFYIENVDTVSGSISFENMSGKNIEYSFDKTNWTALSISSATAVTISNVEPGNKVYLRGTNSAIGSNLNKHIDADFNHNIGGNICSLLDKTNFSTMTSITSNYAFANLFNQDINLISAAFNLGVVTSLGDNALTNVLRNCSSLTTPPDLSNVISLGEFALSYAFRDCSSLTTPPDLSNLTSVGTNALQQAFYNCSSLITAPDLSSVTLLNNYALSSTFYKCSSLTTAPDLSNVISLGQSALSYALYGCSSLITAPDLRNVTSLGQSALSSTFRGCSKLQTVYVPNVSTWDTSIFDAWVGSAGSSAVIPKRMVFKTQALLDACPSGDSGYGNYTKVLAS